MHDRYREGLRSIQLATGALIGATWAAVRGLNEPAEDAFVRAATGAVLVAQSRAVAVTDAYFAAVFNESPRGLPVAELTGASVRGGVAPSEVYRRPFGVARGALASGRAWDQAMSRAAHRAVQTARTDVALSARAARDHVIRTDDRIVGYRRVTGGDACKLCAAAVGSFAKNYPMPLHPACNCVAEPIIGKRVRPDALPETVQVVDHGELGPVLYDAGHHFTEQ